jgi:hypothetical protein
MTMPTDPRSFPKTGNCNHLCPARWWHTLGAAFLAASLIFVQVEPIGAKEESRSKQAPATARDKRWLEDIDYFANELPVRQKDFLKLIPARKFEHQVTELKRDVHQLSDADIVLPLSARGHLYVLIGPATLSSGLIAACALTGRCTELCNQQSALPGVKQSSDLKAILVGQPTGEKPNHYGEALTMTLPNSRLLVQYAVKYFRLMPADSRSLEPDVPASRSMSDALSGRDPVLDAALGNLVHPLVEAVTGGTILPLAFAVFWTLRDDPVLKESGIIPNESIPKSNSKMKTSSSRMTVFDLN